LYDFTAADGVRHTVWRAGSDQTRRLVEAFGGIPQISAGLMYRDAAAVWRGWNPLFWFGIRLRGCLAESNNDAMATLQTGQPPRSLLKRFAAFLIQGAIALALVAFGALQHDGFEAMVEFTAPVFWSFLMLVGIALFVLRARDGSAERPFRVPLFPLTPIVFCVACAWLAYSSIAYAASRNAVHVSLLVMAAGVVAMLFLRRGSVRRAVAGDD